MCLSAVRRSVPVEPVIRCVPSAIHVRPGTCLKSAPWPRYRPLEHFMVLPNTLQAEEPFLLCSWATYSTTQGQFSSVSSCPSGPSPFWSTGRERWPPWPITGIAWTSMKKRSRCCCTYLVFHHENDQNAVIEYVVLGHFMEMVNPTVHLIFLS